MPRLAPTTTTVFGFDLISSGGTAKAIASANLPVTKVSDYTGSPEILGGRVKTLHPKIHGGILARQDLAADQQDLADNGIRPLDLVVVNLYPFEQTIATAGVTLAEAIENIDIGGPAMLRAAAKNHAHLSVYPDLLPVRPDGDRAVWPRQGELAGDAAHHPLPPLSPRWLRPRARRAEG